MAKRYKEEELWSLLRFAVGLAHGKLVDAPMALIVREHFGSPKVVGLVIAEGDEEIETLAESFEPAAASTRDQTGPSGAHPRARERAP